MDEVVVNLLVELLAASICFGLGSIFTILAMRFSAVRGYLAKVGVYIHIPRPQLDLTVEYIRTTDSTNLEIKNAGSQSAYNVYVFLFEVFHGTENKAHTITSLGGEKIRAGVLAPNEKISFTGKNVRFDGCNITAEQEIWVEYTDEFDRHYRTRITPPTPRGDDQKVLPPRLIKNRIPRIPSLKYQSEGDYESLRTGDRGLSGISYL